MRNRYDVLSLIPYDNKSAHIINKERKIELLFLLQQIINFSIIAHAKFMEGNLSDFDAQVGENLCQIRAYKILTLKINMDRAIFFAELTKVKQIQAKVVQIINTSGFNERPSSCGQTLANNFTSASPHPLCEHLPLMSGEKKKRKEAILEVIDKDEMIGSFLNKTDLFVELSEHFIFIFICFFLTKFSIKKDAIPVAIDLDLISKEFNISKNKAKRLTHKYQVLISEMGCRFIMEVSSQIFPELKYKLMLMNTYKISDENRHVLPCFLVTEVVFYHAMQKKIPVVFIVKRHDSHALKDVIYFTFLQCKNTLKFCLISPDDYIHQYGIVVYGLSCTDDVDDVMDTVSYIKKMLVANPMTLLLANAASHVQFSGKTLDRFKTNPYQDIKDVSHSNSEKQHHQNSLEQMQKYAVAVGCSEDNQRMFFVKHIYADKISRVIHSINMNYRKKTYCAYQVYNKMEMYNAIS